MPSESFYLMDACRKIFSWFAVMFLFLKCSKSFLKLLLLLFYTKLNFNSSFVCESLTKLDSELCCILCHVFALNCN